MSLVILVAGDSCEYSKFCDPVEYGDSGESLNFGKSGISSDFC